MLDSVDYNPDVLTCLANLSNDEVFTPPNLVNDILDMLPQELFKDKTVTFLDPVTKSGVFLREIAKRLMSGLEDHIPDKQERINHIFQNQLYGIAITELTSLLSRRSVYCSKTANGKYSICNSFDDEQGNIAFERVEHTWDNGKCKFCGASQGNYDRGEKFETYAYKFIHTENPEELFNMKFDVIIGNPPYQLDDGGFGKSAKPIYNLFIDQAKKLEPRYLTMIVPARWFAGGKGLDSFRERMLNDGKLKQLVDFTDARDCFPSVDIAGGVCYFLWEKDYKGNCEIVNIHKGAEYKSFRPLNEFSTFIRFGLAVDILKKIQKLNENTMNKKVSSTNPFGLKTNDRPDQDGELTLVSSQKTGPLKENRVTSNLDIVGKWKVMTSKASHDHAGQPDKDGMRRVLSKLEVLEPNVVCTGSYIILENFSTKEEAVNLITYMKTRFARFLISLLSFSQDITRDRFSFVPVQDFSKSWSDDMLYKKYSLSKNEIKFIESMIRVMDLNNE
mgnify:CR=1 FL=1